MPMPECVEWDNEWQRAVCPCCYRYYDWRWTASLSIRVYAANDEVGRSGILIHPTIPSGAVRACRACAVAGVKNYYSHFTEERHDAGV